MSRKSLKTKHIVEVLQQLGFVIAMRKGSHAVFRHEGTGLVITIPVARDEIPLVYLRAIERQIDNFNIIPGDKLHQLLYSEDES